MIVHEWTQEQVDLGRERQVQRSRIEVITGSRAGEIVEEEHLMTAWTWHSWEGAIEPSPFDEIAAYDGDETERPFVERGATGGLLGTSSPLSRSQNDGHPPDVSVAMYNRHYVLDATVYA